MLFNGTGSSGDILCQTQDNVKDSQKTNTNNKELKTGANKHCKNIKIKHIRIKNNGVNQVKYGDKNLCA